MQSCSLYILVLSDSKLLEWIVMAFLSGKCPCSLHIYPVPHAFHLTSFPLASSGTTSRAHASFNVTYSMANRVTCLQHTNIVKRKAGLLNGTQKPSSPFKESALFSVPLLGGLLLPHVATAVGMDGLSSWHQFIHSFPLADLDPSVASLLIQILGPVFASLNFLFIIRIVMSWYPQLPVDKFPYVIAFAPTEPVLEPTRRLIPPVGGVDVSPVIWVALMSFVNEILLGQQGLLVLLSQQ